MAELKGVFTSDEVCETLKITKRTLYNYIRCGQIKASKVGREWRFTQEQVDEFLANGTTKDYFERLKRPADAYIK